jgi:hypothetical protein
MKRITAILFAAILAAPSPALAARETPYQKTIREACGKWQPMMKAHGLPPEVFMPIAYRESRCQPKAIGWNYRPGKTHRDCKLSPASTYRRCRAVKSYDIGLFQINSTWVTVTRQICKPADRDILILQEPACNMAVAARLYDGGRGLSNWRATSGA